MYTLASATTPRTLSSTATVTVSATAVQRGTLYVVATPIGNVGDFSTRAAKVLDSVDLIAAEDTRVAGLLLQKLGISSRGRLLSCHAHNEGSSSRLRSLLSTLDSGSVALVTDAGTPCISDPGHAVIRAASSAGYRVSPIPGACAVAAALSVSGLGGGDGHVFVGFLPRSGSARTRRLTAAVGNQYPTVLYEAPHRLLATLRDLAALAPNRVVCVGRELTKRYETVYHLDSLKDAVEYFENEEPRGEFAIVLDTAPSPASASENAVEDTEIDLGKVATALLDAGIGVKTASQILSQSSGVSRKEVYQHLLKLKSESDDK